MPDESACLSMPSSDSASMSFKVCASFPEQSNWDRRCWPATSDIPAQVRVSFFDAYLNTHSVAVRPLLTKERLKKNTSYVQCFGACC